LPMIAMVIVAVTMLKSLDRSTDVSQPAATSPVADVAEAPEGVGAVESGSLGVAEPGSLGEGEFSLTSSLPRSPAPRLPTPPALRLPTEPPQVILRIRDELTQQERLVTIPSVVFGAEPVFASTRATSSDLENVY
jgi:hypothetical protein